MEPNDHFSSLNGKATSLTFLQCLIESNGYWVKKVFINFGEKISLKVNIIKMFNKNYFDLL